MKYSSLLKVAQKNALSVTTVAVLSIIGSSTAYAIASTDESNISADTNNTVVTELDNQQPSPSQEASDVILNPIAPTAPIKPIQPSTRNSNVIPVIQTETKIAPVVENNSSSVTDEVIIKEGGSQSSRTRVRIENNSESTVNNRDSGNGNSSFTIEIKESTSGN